MKMLIIASLLFAQFSQADCSILTSLNAPVPAQHDPLFAVLVQQNRCPQNVRELKEALNKVQLASTPYMVANRGYHNPALGSFSFFEEVTGIFSSPSQRSFSIKKGQFFYGHFTEVDPHNALVLAQTPLKGSLMIEAIAWDPQKYLFNFYELIGNGQNSSWHYRGDSLDAFKDNRYLHLQVPPGQKPFGTIMRCSACHMTGTPIMKELSFPHNDWWREERPLPLGEYKVSQEVQNILRQLQDASILSKSVLQGIHQLESSQTLHHFLSQLSLKEQLRPLFCEVQINLVSDKIDDPPSEWVSIPSEFFINHQLTLGDNFLLSRKRYEELLAEFSLHFPETNNNDGDHAWLVPIKGASDQLAIQSLIERGVISKAFTQAVLSVDMKNPLFSSSRCGLLQALPEEATPGWEATFKEKHLPPPEDLSSYMSAIQKDLSTTEGSQYYFHRLLNDRQAVLESRISQNPLGQILEPGFRVIFPQSSQPTALIGTTSLKKPAKIL